MEGRGAAAAALRVGAAADPVLQAACWRPLGALSRHGICGKCREQHMSGNSCQGNRCQGNSCQGNSCQGNSCQATAVRAPHHLLQQQELPFTAHTHA